MEKYKVCPACGCHNEPMVIECIECEADLMSVPVVDEKTEKVAENTKTAVGTAIIRLCDCGAKNPANARKCGSCGEDITDITPTPDTADEITHYTLTALDDDYTFEVNVGSTVIGRESGMQNYLGRKTFVSRKHAEFLLKNDKLSVKNFSQTNFTYINNEKIGNEFTELHDGDILSLGGIDKNGSRQQQAAYFLVRIGSCT